MQYTPLSLQPQTTSSSSYAQLFPLPPHQRSSQSCYSVIFSDTSYVLQHILLFPSSLVHVSVANSWQLAREIPARSPDSYWKKLFFVDGRYPALNCSKSPSTRFQFFCTWFLTTGLSKSGRFGRGRHYLRSEDSPCSRCIPGWRLFLWLCPSILKSNLEHAYVLQPLKTSTSM